MSAYLQIAETVLRAFRRPLTARAILNEGIRSDLIPTHLFGATQHKTLQARLSEDILYRREQSAFFRTRPGHFFLREFLRDDTIPPEYRQPITARRRARDLIRGEPLSVQLNAIPNEIETGRTYGANDFFRRIPDEAFCYIPYSEELSTTIPIWSLAFLRRGRYILSHRAGRYRDDRMDFLQKRTLTFASLTLEHDYTLFDAGNYGIENSALTAVAIDLDIPTAYGGSGLSDFVSSARFIRAEERGTDAAGLLVYVEISPPDWFEPVTRRLSLNDLRWTSISPPPNNLEDFDPWSRELIAALSRDENTMRG